MVCSICVRRQGTIASLVSVCAGGILHSLFGLNITFFCFLIYPFAPSPYLSLTHTLPLSLPLSEGKNGNRITHVNATVGAPPDRQEDISYTDLRVIGSGSFGVVYQARLLEINDSVAIKKVLQDKRFKVRTGTRIGV